ncbi:hypothetical protein H0A69_22105 [Eoetvoesia caeni]|nr:hypothetical protein [Eoetvoesiella caeni]
MGTEGLSMKKSLRERQLDAEFYCNRWLADGNEALENGDKSKADFCFAKSQFWLDRSNLLLGHSDKAPPKQ